MNQLELERQSDSSSSKSISVRDWLDKVPNPIDPPDHNQSVRKAAPENINNNKNNPAAQPPKENVYLSMPPYIQNTNYNSSGIYNKVTQKCSFNAPSTSRAATMLYPVPEVPTFTFGSATNGLPQRQQPYRTPVASEPNLLTNTVYTYQPTTSNNNLFNTYENISAPIGHSTQHNFNQPQENTSNNFQSNAPFIHKYELRPKIESKSASS